MGVEGASGIRWRALACALAVLSAGPTAALAQGAADLDAPREAQAQPSTADGAAGAYEAEWLAVAPPALLGVEDAIDAPLRQQLAETGTALGYRLRSAGQVATAVDRVGPGRVPTPADLWRITYACGAHASVHARVWAQGGQYVVEVTVALLDGRGPFVVRGRTDHVAFLATVDGLVRESLPPAGTAAPLPPPRVTPRTPPAGLSVQDFEPAGESTPARPPPPVQRFGIAVTTDAAFGPGKERFYNQLVGVRFDVRLTHEVVLGAYTGYANLDGYQGRVSNLVTYLQIEDRVRVSDRHKLRIPLRFAAGYVPNNGAVLRIAAGLAHPRSDRVEWGFDLLCPMIWFLPGGNVATSLNLGFEMIFNP